MNPTINVAIIGAGIGEQHLSAYRQLADRYTVSHVCDIDLQRAAAIVGTDTDIQITGDYQAVLSDGAVDLIDICLPPHLHFETVVAALDHKKHVICEKPLVNSLHDADRLAEHAQQSKRHLFPVFQYRYGPGVAQLQALMAAGLAGKPLVASIETHWNRQADYYAVPWRGTWAGEQGGAVLGHAIHNHDLLCTLFGPVRRLSAFAGTRVNDIEVEDCATVSLQLENGAFASSSITLGAASDTTRLRFCFENLTAESGTNPYAPAEDEWTFSARGPVSQQQIDNCLAAVGDVKSGYVGLFDAVADELSDPSHLSQQSAVGAVSLADGRRSLELVSAIYHAVRTSSVVELPLLENSALYDGWSV